LYILIFVFLDSKLEDSLTNKKCKIPRKFALWDSSYSVQTDTTKQVIAVVLVLQNHLQIHILPTKHVHAFRIIFTTSGYFCMQH
jgi:hypothetical protein